MTPIDGGCLRQAETQAMSKLAPVHIETSRTYLRPPRVEDAQILNAAIAESYAEIKPWIPWAKSPPSVEDSTVYCRESIEKFDRHEAFNYLMFSRASDEFIAGIGVPRLDWAVPMFEIGYWCRTSQVGKGYVAEAVSALSEVCFVDLGAARLELRIDALNARSVAVAETCGYQFESLARHSSRNNAGELCDIKIFSCINASELTGLSTR